MTPPEIAEQTLKDIDSIILTWSIAKRLVDAWHKLKPDPITKSDSDWIIAGINLGQIIVRPGLKNQRWLLMAPTYARGAIIDDVMATWIMKGIQNGSLAVSVKTANARSVNVAYGFPMTEVW